MISEAAQIIRDIIIDLGGVATLSQIYARCPQYRQSSIRRTIQSHSSDTITTPKSEDIFFSVNGLGNGTWGVRNYYLAGSNENDIIPIPDGSSPAEGPTPRKLTNYNRIVRDTALVNEIKKMVNHQCQLCGLTLPLPQGKFYIEGHHIKPLGYPYNGADTKENIIIVCPNCHIKCDYKLVRLNIDEIRNNIQGISPQYIDFHNQEYKIRVEAK